MTIAKPYETPAYTVSFDVERERCFVKYHYEGQDALSWPRLASLCEGPFGGPVEVEFLDVGERGEEVYTATRIAGAK